MNIKKLEGVQAISPEMNVPGSVVSVNGAVFNIFDFKLEYVNTDLIARSLAMQPRYMGHTHGFYSIAQHCVRGAEALLLCGNVLEAIQFLLHDASEAYISDIPAPLKRYLDSDGRLKELENKIEAVIYEYYGVPFPLPDIIKIVDNNLAQEEMMNLMIFPPNAQDEIFYWNPDYAYSMYKLTYNRLANIYSTLIKKSKNPNGNN